MAKGQSLQDPFLADSDPVVNGNSGVLAISATLTDKGLANRDEVVAAIFSYLNLLRDKGVDKRYFDELAHVLDLDFRYPSITRDMDYVEWLADTMIRVPVEHTPLCEGLPHGTWPNRAEPERKRRSFLFRTCLNLRFRQRTTSHVRHKSNQTR